MNWVLLGFTLLSVGGFAWAIRTFMSLVRFRKKATVVIGKFTGQVMKVSRGRYANYAFIIPDETKPRFVKEYVWKAPPKEASVQIFVEKSKKGDHRYNCLSAGNIRERLVGASVVIVLSMLLIVSCSLLMWIS